MTRFEDRTEAGERPISREGEPGSSKWIVLDYFDLVVHVFATEQRAYYDLERLWGDAPTEHVADDGSEVALLRADAPLPKARAENVGGSSHTE